MITNQTDEYNKIDNLIDDLSKIYDNEFNSKKYDSLNDFWKSTKHLRIKISDLYSELRLIQIPKMSPIPDYGDHMTLEYFINCCKNGLLISYDGFGKYATNNEMSDIEIYPSDIKRGKYRKDFSHVVWFNR